MIVYTDLHNRSKIYNIPKKYIEQLSKLGIYIITKYSKDVEVYWGDLLTKKDIDNLPNLKWIHFSCVGINRALIPEVINSNIKVTNSKGIFKESVSSTVMSYIYCFARGFHFVNQLRHKQKLTRNNFDLHFNSIKNLTKSKCLIVGFGDIGSRIGKLCYQSGLEVNVIKNDLSKGIPNYVNKSYTLNSLKKAVIDNDFVINLLPLTTSTYSIFDKEIFLNMKPDSYFINVGRGQSVNEYDLIESLKNKQIMGAALDVFNKEPLSNNSPLWGMENVIITPHIANLGTDYWDDQIKLFTLNLQKLKNNNLLLNQINLNKEY